MQAQSTNFSQKLTKYNQILSILALCAFTGVLLINNTILTQALESSSNMMMHQSQSSSSNQVTSIQTSIFTGELDQKDGNTIFVSKDNQVKQYSITSDIKIRRDSVESSVEMLKTGDALTINQSQDGKKIFSIDAISKQNNDLIKWGIAVAVLVLIIIPLIIYLLNKSKQGHIRTNISNKS